MKGPNPSDNVVIDAKTTELQQEPFVIHLIKGLLKSITMMLVIEVFFKNHRFDNWIIGNVVNYDLAIKMIPGHNQLPLGSVIYFSGMGAAALIIYRIMRMV